MATFVKFYQFATDLGEKVHNLNSDTLNVYLSNDPPVVATDAVKADIVAITSQNGYAPADIQNAATATGGVLTVTAVDVVFTATGGSFGPFQYAVIYNDTPTSPLDPLIGYVDYGSAITVLTGETFTVDFGASLMTLS
jgi:hypothetical protein